MEIIFCVAGIMVGVVFGVFIMALLRVAADADRNCHDAGKEYD